MFQKKLKEAVRNCEVAAHGFPTFSCYTMLVPYILLNTGQNMALKASRVDITAVGFESEVDDYWNQALVLQNTDQHVRCILPFSSDADSLVFSISIFKS